jgi:hypothetical protein
MQKPSPLPRGVISDGRFWMGLPERLAGRATYRIKGV